MSTNHIDNPGAGDCVYYAFAIGLIEHIQFQYQVNPGQSLLLDKWQQLDPSLSEDMVAQIKTFDMREMAKAPRTYSIDLLNKLQQSLRNICYEQQMQSLYQTALDSNLYADFHALVQGQPDKRFNVLANSDDVLALAAGISDKNDEDAIKSMFLSDVNDAHHSSIVLAASAMTAQGYWATERELCALAQVFDLNPKITNLQHPQGFTLGRDEGKPTITLHNQGNYHWVTELQQPLKQLANSKSEVSLSKEKQENYKHLLQSLFINKDWQSKPICSDSPKRKANESEAEFGVRQQIHNDELLARKLQAQELENGGEEEAKRILSSFSPR